MCPDVQPDQSRWAKCSASEPAALQHHLAAHAHHSQALMVSFSREPGESQVTFTENQVLSTSRVLVYQQQCHEMHLVVAHHLLRALQDCKGNLSKDPFAACLICHMRDYIGGGKKGFVFFFPPPKWAFLSPCASLEINFQHLAAFSHDSARCLGQVPA